MQYLRPACAAFLLFIIDGSMVITVFYLCVNKSINCRWVLLTGIDEDLVNANIRTGFIRYKIKRLKTIWHIIFIITPFFIVFYISLKVTIITYVIILYSHINSIHFASNQLSSCEFILKLKIGIGYCRKTTRLSNDIYKVAILFCAESKWIDWGSELVVYLQCEVVRAVVNY